MNGMFEKGNRAPVSLQIHEPVDSGHWQYIHGDVDHRKNSLHDSSRYYEINLSASSSTCYSSDQMITDLKKKNVFIFLCGLIQSNKNLFGRPSYIVKVFIYQNIYFFYIKTIHL